MANDTVDVKCCDESERYGIYFNYEVDRFYLIMEPQPITYCPWCGILLDINIVEKYNP
jgi:hypothetical protein